MKYIKRGKWQGFRQLGTVMVSKDDRETHMRKASWLTAMVESGGKFGCVINFDRTGITAGLHQAIAVYPKQIRRSDGDDANDQGPLWRLLKMASGQSLYEALAINARWQMLTVGKVRHTGSGDIVSGPDMLTELAGSPDGKVPEFGEGRERSKRWVQLFHEHFSDPRTFDAQEQFGIDHFTHRAKRARMRFSDRYKGYTAQDLFYRHASVDQETFEQQPSLDLALCVYWSHSVNAPSMALKVMCRSLKHWNESIPAAVWAQRFIRMIATTKYGHWHEDEKNGRYDRTRKYAMQSGFWPRGCFVGPNAVMPKEF